MKYQANIFLFTAKCYIIVVSEKNPKHLESIFFKHLIIMTVLYTLVYQGVKNPILIVLLHLTVLTKVLTLNARFSCSLFGVCPITSLIFFFF